MKTKKIIVSVVVVLVAIAIGTNCKRKINPELTDPFVKASYEGKMDQIEKLYKEGADVNGESKANYDNTPLTTASNAGQIEVMKFLLKNGADVNKKTSNGYNALGSALTGGRLDAVKLLISSKADVNDSGKYGTTPLQRVEKWSQDSPTAQVWKDAIEILKQAGAK
ncbi:MAG: ankyrin repeat domain-containing protein [Leptospira sp.]|nr:ankyrin repeat domain-containing protein [Leptospira sp.]